LKLPIDIKVVIPTTNIKVSRARNYIIEHALSKYITFKDDDDLSVNINKILKHVLDWDTKTTVKLFYTLSGSYNYKPPEIENEKMEKTIPFVSQLGIWSSIYDVEFLRRNNIYFVPDIGSEDVVFRAVLHHIIDKYEGKFEIIDEILYYYLDPSNRSFTFSLSPREEHDVKTILNGKSIAEFVDEQQQTSDKIMKKLFEFDKERFEVTDYILFGISHAATFKSSLNIIRNTLTKHNNFLQTEMDRALFKLTKEIKVVTEESIFDTLEPEVQELALYLAPMYLTLSELDEVANHDLETLNLLYNRKLKSPVVNLNTKVLNPFMTRFLMLYSLITKTDSEFIDLDLAKKIYQTFCSNYSKTQFKNDFITFSRRVDELNTDDLNEVIKKHKLKDLYAEFIHFMKYDHINTLKNSNLHFRGMLNVFSFYVLSYNCRK
jgi:thiaminase